MASSMDSPEAGRYSRRFSSARSSKGAPAQPGTFLVESVQDLLFFQGCELVSFAQMMLSNSQVFGPTTAKRLPGAGFRMRGIESFSES